MNELQKIDNGLSKEKTEMCKAVFNYNCLTPFPLSDLQIKVFAADINRFWPWLDPDTLSNIIDAMKLGSAPFDSKLLFQNIAIAIDWYKKGHCAIYNEKETTGFTATNAKWHEEYVGKQGWVRLDYNDWDLTWALPKAVVVSRTENELNDLIKKRQNQNY